MKKKNRRIKFFTVFLTIIIAVTTILMNTSKALELTNLPGMGFYALNQVIQVGYGDLKGSTSLYCLQKDAHLGSQKKSYVVNRFIYIDGNYATICQVDANGNYTKSEPIYDELNGQVAFLLKESKGYGANVSNPSTEQQALWHIANIWFQKLGLSSEYYLGNKNDKYEANECNTKAEEYSASVGHLKYDDLKFSDISGNNTEKELNVIDETNRTNLQLSSNGYIGPFKWRFDGKVKEIKVNDSAVSTIYTSSTGGAISASDLTTGSEFWISQSNVSNNNLESIEISVSEGDNNINPDNPDKICVAELYFLQSAGYQNLMYVNAGEFDVQQTNELGGNAKSYYNFRFTTSLQLVKVDDRNNQVPLTGVKFIFKAQVMMYEKYGEHTVHVSHSQYGCSKVYTCGHNDGDKVCGKSSHSHSSDCYDIYGNKTCGKESHSHSDSCYHHHSNSCWHWSCGKSQDSNHDYTAWDYHPVEKTMYMRSDYTWTENRNEAYEFTTDSAGEINLGEFRFKTRTLENQGDGTRPTTRYITDYFAPNPNVKAVEMFNPYYGYEQEVGKEYNLNINAGTNKIASRKLENHQRKVKLSGYVWVEQEQGKTSVGNSLRDSNEVGLDGVKVTLVNKSTGGRQSTYSGSVSGIYNISGGQWQMEVVEGGIVSRLEDLSNCYVEFEYCGVTYQCVTQVIDSEIGSKALDTNSRQVLDSAFANVLPNGTNSIRSINNGNEGRPVTINYQGVNSHKNSFAPTTGKDSANDDHGGHNMSGCDVYSTTDQAGYNIWQHFSPSNPEIKYINLGVFKKAQTDFALVQDLYNVRTTINGYSHIYNYNKVRGESSDYWSDLGVKFQNNKGSYNRAVYQSDYTYKNDKDGEDLVIYLTYKVTLRNESPYLGSINTVTYYYDNRAVFVGVGGSLYNDEENGSKLNKKDLIGDPINASSENSAGDYKYVTIQTNRNLNSGTSYEFYVQIKVDRATVESLVDKDVLKNSMVEIASYTTFKNNNASTPVAVYDIDSVPSSSQPGTNFDGYEDDTDAARSVQFVTAEKRTLEGSVFVDGTLDNGTGKESIGNGYMDNGEKNDVNALCQNMTVELYEIDEGFGYNTSGTMNNPNPTALEKIASTQNSAELIKDASGNYTGDYRITGYVPGNYVVIFKWGNQKYMVQYFKGTIYPDKDRENNEYWYKLDNTNDQYGTNRKNDALDNWNNTNNNYKNYLNYNTSRDAIDNEMEAVRTNILEKEISKAYSTGSDKIKITQMASITPKLNLSVEYSTDETEGDNKGENFNIRNVDFGVVERPEEKVDLKKRISEFKITLANGQIIADVKIDEKGNMTGTKNYTTYMGPTNKTISYKDGLLKTEMDTELLEGAKVDITYKMIATNVSEVDFWDYGYYNYGIKPANLSQNYVRYSITHLLDYTDESLNVDDSNWYQILMDEKDGTIKSTYFSNTADRALKNYYNASEIVKPTKVNINGEQKDYKDTVKFYLTEKMHKQLDPVNPGNNGTNVNTIDLHVSKILTSTDDITFDNKVEAVEITKDDDGNHDAVDTPNDSYVNTGSPVKLMENKDNFETTDSETVTIIPSTGENRNYILPITIGVISLVIIGAGIFVIKKKVIGNK